MFCKCHVRTEREREDVCIGMLRTFVFFSSRRSLIAQNKTNNSTACVGTDEQHWLIGAYGKNDGVVAVQSLNMLRNILMGEWSRDDANSSARQSLKFSSMWKQSIRTSGMIEVNQLFVSQVTDRRLDMYWFVSSEIRWYTMTTENTC